MTKTTQGSRVSEDNLRDNGIKMEQEYSTKSTPEHDFGVKVDYESETYINRLFQLEESEQVTHSIVNETKAILKHRNNTKYEDLVFINSDGKVLKQTEYNVESSVAPTIDMLEMLKNNREYTVIAIHNHPESSFMSYDDLFLAAQRKYKYGLIIGHDGTIYKYRVSKTLPNTKNRSKLSEAEKLDAFLIDRTIKTINTYIKSDLPDAQKKVAEGMKTLYNYGIEVDVL